jgi:hypothetical protein
VKNVLAVFVSLAFSVAAIEAFLIWRPEYQALVPFSEFVVCAGPARLVRPHELFGWTAAPESVYYEQTSEADGWAAHAYNADGFRDLFDSGAEQAIVLGDSFTKGADASNDESFPYLLDLWTPDLAIRDFGEAGYGTWNSLAVYEHFSPTIPHKLTILAYFMGNDLRDNLTGRGRAGARGGAGRPPWTEAIKAANSEVRQSSRVYNLLYSNVRAAFGGSDLSGAEIEEVSRPRATC